MKRKGYLIEQIADLSNLEMAFIKARKGKGVPIGNLTSQYFANHYLSVADHFVYEKLHIPAYVRYMDDMLLWHWDKSELLEIGNHYKKYQNGHLNLELKPFCLNRSSRGVPFLGYLLFPERRMLAARSRKRYAAKMILYNEFLKQEKWSQAEYKNHVLPLTAFTMHADARNFRRKIHTDHLIT